MIYVIVIMPVLMGFASLAVDLGRVEAAKTELRAACDAAARYGATGLSNSTAVAKAIQAAADNKVDGTTLVLQTTDVATGSWSSGTFTVGGTPTNAIRVTAGRTAVRGNPIPLVFGILIGKSTCDINATSVGYYSTTSSTSGYGFFATGSIMLQNGPIVVDSYPAATAQYSGTTAENKATVAGDGSILTDNVTVDGNLQAGPGQSISHQNGSLTVTGSTTSLSKSVSYATPTMPTSYTALSNVNVNSGQSLTLGTAGQTTTYYATNFDVVSSATLNVNGPVVLYINGNFEIDGAMNVLNNLPANFTVEQLSSSGVTFNGTSNIYAHVYAPNSPLNMNNPVNFFGTMVVGQMSISGKVKLHDDESNSSSSSSSSSMPSLVQ
jgi:Flp pilus assembly protein TadG